MFTESGGNENQSLAYRRAIGQSTVERNDDSIEKEETSELPPIVAASAMKAMAGRSDVDVLPEEETAAYQWRHSMLGYIFVLSVYKSCICLIASAFPCSAALQNQKIARA